ncbi:hypothetical protein SRABI70_04623 [Pseudomonas sp. Bi70]|nr:hypothetical protein SRABI70_04623 [Pseudomonas sp. Bi70]
MAEGDGAAVRVDLGAVVRQAKVAGDGQALGREGFVQLDHVELLDAQVQARQQLAHRRQRADAHDAWRHATAGHAQHPGAGLEAVLLNGCGRGQDHRRGAIVEARGVAGGNGLVRAVDRLELGQPFGGGVGARVLVGVDNDLALLGLDHHRDDFLGVVTALLGRSSALLATQAKGVLVGAADPVVLGDVVTGDRHRVDTILLLHRRVDEAPAQGGVFQLLATAESAVGLAHHIGRAGH